MKIFINPGHCVGMDPGAINNNWNVTEAEIVLKIGELVKHYLEAVEFDVTLMQSNNLAGEDGQGYVGSVCYTANQKHKSDLFISLHCNAFNRRAKGTEVFYASAAGQKLAQCIQNELVSTLNTVDRGIKANNGLIVLRRTAMPAVLVEIAFIDSDEDCRLLILKQDEIARAIARGVTDSLLK